MLQEEIQKRLLEIEEDAKTLQKKADSIITHAHFSKKQTDAIDSLQDGLRSWRGIHLGEAKIRFELEPVVTCKKPHIVCLCGSTRFMDAFFDAGWQFTLEGKIVLSIGVCNHAKHHGAEALGPEVVERLVELHLRKIDLADSVFVLNVGGYIGESTAKEIEYAEKTGKPIEYLDKRKNNQ